MKNCKENICRIAVTGPESTGKSWLAEKLARHYNTVWVPEYARIYLAKNDGKYVFDDIVKIAKGQKLWEENFLNKADGLLFADTDAIVTKIWSEVVFGKCDEWILHQIENNPYDMYLLCYPDLPWQPDPLRENPDNRLELFELYKNELVSRKLNYKVIKDKGTKRLQNAIDAVDNLFGYK